MIKEHPYVLIELDEHPTCFRPGQAISGRYRLNPSESPAEVQALEWSIAWATEGKGDEDQGIHAIETIREPERGVPQPDQWRRFEVILPMSPLSYEGLIVKVLWRVRIRAVFGKNCEWVGELLFRLGDVDRVCEKKDKTP